MAATEARQQQAPFPGPNKRDPETARVLEAQRDAMVTVGSKARPYNKMCRVKGCGCAMVEKWQLSGNRSETELVCGWAGLDRDGRPVHVQPEIEE